MSTTEAGPASVGQRQLWLMDHYLGAGGALNCPIILRISGDLDRDRLAGALEQVIARHEALRTTFTGRGRWLARKVAAPFAIELPVVDLTDSADPEAAVIEALRAELATRFDVTEQTLRARLWRLGPRTHVLCLNQHHLITDAWSCGIVSRELGQSYSGRDLPEVSAAFSDFVRAETEELSGDRLARLQKYWRTQLDGLSVPRLPERDPNRTRSIAFARTRLNRQTRAGITTSARAHRTTPFAVLLGAFMSVLHAHTGQRDLAVASLLANRAPGAMDTTVGYLANMVLLRVPFPQARSTGEVVEAARKTVVGALVHQALPYQMLPLNTIRAQAVRDVVFQVFAEATHQTTLGASDLTVEPVDPPAGMGARFDLDFVVMPHRDGGFEVVVGYASDRFEDAWVRGFVDRFAEVAAGLAESPSGTMLPG